MAKKCDLCGRSSTKGASRSHSKIKTLKRQNINLQSKTIDGLKARVCTSCMRTMEKPARVKTPRKPGKPEIKPISKTAAKAAARVKAKAAA